MASSFVVYTATGTSGDFAIPFEYFSINHVEARVNNTIVGFTLLAPNLLRITPTPNAGDAVVLRRRTPPDLVVPPQQFPRLVRFFSEESNDIVFNFDSIYGDVFYDITFSVVDGTSDSSLIGVINPQLTLSEFYEQSSVALSEAATALVSFTLTATLPGLEPQVVALCNVAEGSVSGSVAISPGAPTEFPSGTVFRLDQVTDTAFGAATIVVRFRRL